MKDRGMRFDLRKLFAGAAVIFLAIFLVQSEVMAATYYISPSGSDTANGQSSSTPWKSFSKAFSAMAGGDELILLDGTYSEAAGTGYISYLGTGSGQPPSGIGRSAMTTVRALNAGKAFVTGKLFLGRSFRKDSYIKIQGITFEGGGALYNTSYVYIKNCGFHSENLSGGSVFGVGTNDHANGNTFNLVEDSWVWGKERVIAINYRADNNVWRRVVVRGDGCGSASCTGSGNPNVGISVYDSQNVSMQNVLVVDRILGGGSPYGDFASAQHTSGAYLLGPAEWLGCISLKSPDTGFYLEADAANDSTITIQNSMAWDSTSSGFNISSPSWATDLIRNITVRNITSKSGLDNVRIANVPSGTIQNVLSYSAGRYGVNSSVLPSYSDVASASVGNYNQTTCATGCLTTSPLIGATPALKYLVRIESGSALSGTGAGGGDYGANVTKRYGADGAFYGEAGYNTLTSADLWPWPNEGVIKKQMCASVERGFCAKTSGRYGGPLTLSSYIIETLGSSCPASMCVGRSPSKPTGVTAR